MIFEAIQNANIEWQADGLPRSTQFGDIYFSSENAIAETEHVFLKGNQLAERFANKPDYFVIGECGFGSGLNFLCTWRLWQQFANPGDRLHFISCEQFPLSHEDIEKFHALWPELEEFSQALRSVYIDHSNDLHRFHLGSETNPVTLDLLYGDASEQFASLSKSGNTKIDAWFLDGFTPRDNPTMWSAELFRAIRELSDHKTTLATYSVAALVKEGLKNSGFTFEKTKGFGNKRHMLCAHREASGSSKSGSHRARNSDNRIAVIGAGIAGCASAYALAKKGFKVTLIERHKQIAQQASGNPKGVMFLALHRQPSLHAVILRQAYLYAIRHYSILGKNNPHIELQNSGVLQLTKKNSEDFFERVASNPIYDERFVQHVNAATASLIAGIEIYQDALHLPYSGSLSPKALCKVYSEHENIKLITNTEVLALNKSPSCWQLTGTEKNIICESDRVIVANSIDSKLLLPYKNYPLFPNRGQLSYLQENSLSSKLNTILCGKGYISPATNEQHVCGGSFNPGRDDIEVTEEDHQRNLQLLCELCPTAGNSFSLKDIVGGRTSLRCTTQDYLPLVGAVVGPVAGPVNNISTETANNTHDGLYLFTGLGSHGITTSPLLAEYLASEIAEEFLPLSHELTDIIKPSRFEERQKKKT